MTPLQVSIRAQSCWSPNTYRSAVIAAAPLPRRRPDLFIKRGSFGQRFELLKQVLVSVVDFILSGPPFPRK
jgi:hypothetical protein